jgi:hypothetical protein
MIVTNSSIYVENLSSSNPLQTGTTEKLTFNFTESNKHYTGTDFPYVSASSSSQKLITSTLSDPITLTGTFDVNSCNYVFTYLSGAGHYKSVGGFSCDINNKTASAVFTVELGVNTITFIPLQVSETENNTIRALAIILENADMIATLLVAAIIIAILFTLYTNKDADIMMFLQMIFSFLIAMIILVMLMWMLTEMF